jgi:sugar phosphate isomerase/epimerase
MYTRRDFGKLALAAVPSAHLLATPAFARQEKPNSRVRGVMIGMNVPYNFGARTAPLDEIIRHCVTLGISGLELRTQPVEAALGAPAAPAGAGRRGAPPPTPEQEAAQKAAAADLHKWRTSLSMRKVADIRKQFDDAGILVEIVKVDGIFTMPDDVLDYEFNLAKTLGARAISTEIASDLDQTRKVGRVADKHKLMIGYHGHATTAPSHWETAFANGQHNGANLDIGHFVAGNHGSPVPFLRKHHDRITHIHVKDRKANNGPNMPFGQGDTPITEVLRLIRDNRWPIQATIEFEYPIPANSDRMTELKKCVDYCRAALEGGTG